MYEIQRNIQAKMIPSLTETWIVIFSVKSVYSKMSLRLTEIAENVIVVSIDSWRHILIG